MQTVAMTIRLTRMNACFVIRDGEDRALAYVYFENDPIRRNTLNGLTEAEALEIARRIARLLAEDAK